jgi:hypothetical protein
VRKKIIVLKIVSNKLIQITPFVSSSLEQEKQKTSTLSKDQVVQIIINDLKPTGKSFK